MVIEPGPFVTLIADPDLLKQILLNLVSNALRYSPPGTSIILGWRLLPGQVEIWLSDQGIGMDAETLSHVFEPFYQGKAITVSGEKGAGLGLSLTQSMVTAHGGAIRIESTPGQGTSVFVTFPLQ
jgi:signal transduction histidine kinase